MALIKRFFSSPTDSFFLFGPRGTGKSTFLRQHYLDALWIDFLEPDVEFSYRQHPERLSHILAGNAFSKVVIDEVQRVPQVLTVVHKLIEENKKLQFILTGSNSRKLKKAGVDLLAGRALNYTLHPFMAGELKEKFALSIALKNGMLPLIFQANDPIKTLRSYISLYMREEIITEGLVRNMQDFTRFLEAISFSHGSIVNLTNIGRECGVKRKTVSSYLSILEDLLLGYVLPIFKKKAERQLTEHPKFYFFDTGIYRALRPHGPLDKPEEIEGIALEGLVAQHLRAWNDYTGYQHQLFFWRTRGGMEVDFVFYGAEHFWAIEVKNTNRINTDDTKGLRAFLADYPMAKAFLLHRGNEQWQENNILFMPCEKFLQSLRC